MLIQHLAHPYGSGSRGWELINDGKVRIAGEQKM